MGAGFSHDDDKDRTDDPGADQPESGAADGTSADAPAEDAGDNARLDLKDSDERLPWLESEDEHDAPDADAGRALGFVLGGLLTLALLVGGIWWASHRDDETEQVAAGGVIKAPAQAYKEAPKDPGGKTFDGTGDSSFAVSEGQTRPARLGVAPAKPVAAPAKPGATGAPAASAPGGVGVQIAAYSNEAAAKAGWTRLSQQYAGVLSGVPHRIQEGKADIGTVYRLQVVAPDAGAAQALCGKLKGAGLACQVKN